MSDIDPRVPEVRKLGAEIVNSLAGRVPIDVAIVALQEAQVVIIKSALGCSTVDALDHIARVVESTRRTESAL